MATNTLGSVATAAKTAGDATRKLMQGILNPGLMGQGAVAGGLEAADTIFSPNKEKQMAHNNLMDAAQISAEGKQNDAERQMNKQQNEALQNMDAQMSNVMNQMMGRHFGQGTQADWMVMGGPLNTNNPTPYTTQQYKAFLDDFQPEMGKLVAQWKASGVDQNLIDQVVKKYDAYQDIAQKNYKFLGTDEKRANDVTTAQTAAANAQTDAAAANRVIQNTTAHYTAMAGNKAVNKVSSRYLEWAKENGMVADDGQGNLVLTDRNMFIDGRGRTIDDDNFDPRTAKVDYNASNGNIDRFIAHLESTGDKSDASLAANLRAGKIAHDRKEQEFKNRGMNRFFSNTYGASGGIGATKKSLTTGLLEKYGGGLTAEQVESFAKHKGLATTSLDDYDTLATIHKGLRKDMLENDHQRKLEKLVKRINDEMRNNPGQPMPELTDEERELFRTELVYENMTYRLMAMDKMRALDEKMNAFGKKVGADNREVVDENGMPMHISQQDVLHRYRDAAFADMQDGLRLLNDDLDEAIRGTYTSGHKLQGGVVNGKFTKFIENNANAKDQSQAWHLANMVLSDHNNDVIGALGDDTYAGTSPYDTTMGSPTDRRVRARMANFYRKLDDANAILGRPTEKMDDSMVTTTLSEEGKIATAQSNMLLAQMARSMGYGTDSTAGAIMTLNIPKDANRTQGIVPMSDYVRTYQYGEFYNNPPTNNDLTNVRYMVDNLDKMSQLKTSYGTPQFAPSELNAVRQYRTSLVMNTSKARLDDMLSSATPATISPAIVAAYSAYTGRNVTPQRVIQELTQLLGSQEYRTVSDQLRTATPKDGVPTVLGAGNANYMGAGAPTAHTARTIGQIRHDPQLTVGLMNVLFPHL